MYLFYKSYFYILELSYCCEGGNRVICMPQGKFTTLDAKAAGHVGKFMTEVAAAQLFKDNGMNIWHGGMVLLLHP